MEVLKVEDLVVKLKEGERVEELVDKLEKLCKKFSEEGNWWFSIQRESGGGEL